ncbi:formin-like protein 4 [Silene latifolia]|uniref:formin-like protein 4 n=1 Tax=Silene latifolia TaxID=37657 RepID=UPI003D772FDF
MAIQTKGVSLLLTFVVFLNSFSICQSSSLQYVETFYPSSPQATPPSFPPHNASPPRPPPSKHPMSLPTAAGVASASTLVTVGLLFFLCNKSARHRKDGSSDGGGGGCAAVNPYPVATAVTDDGTGGAAAEAGMMEGNVEKLIVDHKVNLVDGLQTATVVALPPPPPLPPPIPCKKGPAPPPPPPPKKGGASASPRPPLPPKRSPSGNDVVDDGTEDKSNQVKLKPLHWEKVNVVNRHHSMVWDNIEHGSFQYNGDMMEALFGKAATTQNPTKDGNSSDVKNTSQNPVAKISIFDSRRSQNIAIVIRSLGGIQMKELIEGLLEGKGLNVQILEKLTRIALPEEEKTKILSFDGEVERLCDAESFLYRLLKAVPLAFTRINAMLFRYTYDSEIEQLKVTLQTLETACGELRNPGVFLKLLEAVLKAGNRVNAGTARGEAKAFNLTALLKLSDYKSSDGKSTLLHFVVHEVARNEGRRWLTKNQSPVTNPCELKLNSDQQKEFLKVGLPIVRGLSSEFSNVKKSAIIDYHTLSDISSLGARLDETRELILHCGAESGQEEFIKEMEEFLRGAEAEIKVVQEEESRVIELVKKTTQYYQSGAFKEKRPLELFAIVRDFLGMVDKACINISKELEEKKANSAGTGSLAPPSSLALPPSTPDVTCVKISEDLEDKKADSFGNDSLAPPSSLALPSTPDFTCVNVSKDLEDEKANSAEKDSLAPPSSLALPSTPDFTCVDTGKDLEDKKANSAGNDSLAPSSSLALPSTPDVTCINISKDLEDKNANSAGNDSLAPPSSLASTSTPDLLTTQGTFLRLPDYSISEKSNGSGSDDDF